MYDFHYNVMKSRYGKNINLLFTDTDSLMYEIFTEDIYQDMMTFKDYFDTSAYDVENKLHSTVNKKVVGKMKDELSGKCFIQIGIPAYLISNHKYKIHVELSMKQFFINTEI